ncbi:MAG: DUF1353 domain-containing protein [Solirubrobacterales bacterium]
MSRFTAPLIVTPLDDGRTWVIVTDGFGYDVGEKGSGDTIEVPQGMTTNFASVPRAAWWFAAPWGKHGHAAVVHDAGYWLQKRSRKEYDDIFLEGMAVLGVGRAKRRIMFLAVRWFGGPAWRNSARRTEEDPSWKLYDTEGLEQLRADAEQAATRAESPTQ